MAEELNVAGAVEFLEFVFGSKPNGIILTRRMHPDPPKGQENEPRYNKASHWPLPSALERSPTWQEEAGDWNCFFSTCTVKSKDSPRKDGHYVECPVLWFDLDALKQLPMIRADEVYQELLDMGIVSALVRSSAKGIQGFFKLDEPVQLNGKKAVFNDTIKPTLLNLSYYFGGDLAVCTVGNYMRIPGTFNVKKQYAEPYQIRARYLRNTYSLGDLAKRFPTNPHICPLPVWYGLAGLAEEVWEEGMRHQFTIGLCGTLRRAGIDRESCRSAVRQVYEYMKHEAIDNELETVDSTYDLDLQSGDTKLQTLYSQFPDVAKKAETIAEWWVKFKQVYCKKVGISWKPDNYDPREDPNKPTGTFWEDNMQTYYMAHGKDGPYEKLFANFAVRMKGKLYDPITHEDVMVGEIVTAGQNIRLIEMPPDRHTSWDKFSTIKNLPSGVACFDRQMWQQYIGYLSQQNVDKPNKVKVRYYGIFDPGTKATLVIPSMDHPKYTWLNQGVDTVTDPEVYLRQISKDDQAEYLQDFGKHYPYYHESRYIYPALGWFAASMISAFLREIGDGYPTLMICGLPGSGKSTLIKEVIAPHFGLKMPKDFGQTTRFALGRMLTANNMFAGIMDEFRDVREDKTQDLQSLIRSLWDGTERGFGVGGGETREERLVGTLCILGEHHYADEATLHRTFSIRIDRHWLDLVKNASESQQQKLARHRLWLEDNRNTGLMGSILLQWIMENLDLIPDIVENARRLVEDEAPINNPRKQWGFVCIAAGILLLASVYRDFGVKFFVTKKMLLDAMLSADTHLSDFESYDTDTMRTLFQKTDHQIIQMLQRTGKTPEGSTYHFDPDDKDILHFDINRWHSMIAPELRKTSAAALVQVSTFTELLQDSTKDPNSVVMGFGTSLVFPNSVAISISRVVNKYRVGVNQWKTIEQMMNEAEDY